MAQHGSTSAHVRHTAVMGCVLRAGAAFSRLAPEPDVALYGGHRGDARLHEGSGCQGAEGHVRAGESDGERKIAQVAIQNILVRHDSARGQDDPLEHESANQRRPLVDSILRVPAPHPAAPTGKSDRHRVSSG